MPPIRAPGMVKGVASLHSGSQTGGSKKPGARKFAPFNKLSEEGNRVDGKEVPKDRLKALASKRARLRKEGKDLSKKESDELGSFGLRAGCDSAAEIRARAFEKRIKAQMIADGLQPIRYAEDPSSNNPSDAEMDELDDDEADNNRPNNVDSDDEDQEAARDSDAPVKRSVLPVNPIKKKQQIERTRLRRQAASEEKKREKAKGERKKGKKTRRMRAEVSDDSDVAEEKEREKERKRKRKATKNTSSSSRTSASSSSTKSNARKVLDGTDSDTMDVDDDASEEEERRPRPPKKQKTKKVVKRKEAIKDGRWDIAVDEEEPLFAQPTDEEEDMEENPTWAHEGEESEATRRRRIKGKGRARESRSDEEEFDQIVETEEEEEETELFKSLVAPVSVHFGVDLASSSSRTNKKTVATSPQSTKRKVVDSDEEEEEEEDDDEAHEPSLSRSHSQEVIEISDSENEDSDDALPTVDKTIAKIPRTKSSSSSSTKSKFKTRPTSTSASTSKKSKPTPASASSKRAPSSSSSRSKPSTPLSPSKLSTSQASTTYDRNPTSKTSPRLRVIDDDEDDPFALRLGKAIKTPKAAPIVRPSANGPQKLGGGGGVKVGKPAGVATMEMEERIRQRKAAERRAGIVGGGGAAGSGVGGRGRVVAGSAPERSNLSANAIAGPSRQHQPSQPQVGPSRPRSSLLGNPTFSSPPTSTSSSSNSSFSNGPKTPSSLRKPPPAATGPRSWSCVNCTFDNPPHLGDCEICRTPRRPAKEMFKGGWECEICGGMNEPEMWGCWATKECGGMKRSGQ